MGFLILRRKNQIKSTLECKIPFGLKLARQASRKSSYKQKPMGAAYISGSTIVTGSNKLKTSPLSAELGSRSGRIHAEVAVLKKLQRDAKNGVLFVFREKKNGELALARPCEPCMKLIKKFKIKTVVYSTNGGFAKENLI